MAVEAMPSVPNGYVPRHLSVERITFILVSLSLSHPLLILHPVYPATPIPLHPSGSHSIQWRSRNASPPISFGRCGVLHIARLGAITLFVFTSLSSYIGSPGPFSIVLSQSPTTPSAPDTHTNTSLSLAAHPRSLRRGCFTPYHVVFSLYMRVYAA